MAFKLNELKITGIDVKPASVVFKDGLNVITGPSNTGKTYIFQCINYMLGSSKQPKAINQAKKYNTIYLEIQISNGTKYTLESNLKGGDFKLFNEPIDKVNSGSKFQILNRKHDPDRQDNISTFLLGINGLTGKQIRTNAKGKKRSISYRDIVRFLLIDENRIITDTSPILSGQYMTVTAEENVFKYILSGQDDSEVFSSLTEKQITHRKGKIELLTELINNAERELSHYPQIHEADSQLSKLEDTISSLREEHLELRNSFVKLDTKRKDLSNNLIETQSENTYLSELLLRSKILKEQYESDINRLKSTIEVSNLLMGEHTFTSHCPLCNSELKESCNDDDVNQIIKSCNLEILKIISLTEELLKSELLIASEKQRTSNLLLEIKTDIDLVTEELDGDIGQKLTSCIENLNDANNIKNKVLQAKLLHQKLQELIDQRHTLKINISQPKETFDKISTSLVSRVSEITKTILEKCNYPELTTVSFSEGKNDLVISGEDRELAGKGYRAITYSAFILALQEYIYGKDYSLGVVVLDSPLVTYKKPESDIEADDLIPVDLAMDFYRYAAKNQKIEQVIILENELPPIDILHLIHEIKFTQSQVEGRYGFFPI